MDTNEQKFYNFDKSTMSIFMKDMLKLSTSTVLKLSCGKLMYRFVKLYHWEEEEQKEKQVAATKAQQQSSESL